MMLLVVARWRAAHLRRLPPASLAPRFVPPIGVVLAAAKEPYLIDLTTPGPGLSLSNPSATNVLLSTAIESNRDVMREDSGQQGTK